MADVIDFEKKIADQYYEIYKDSKVDPNSLHTYSSKELVDEWIKINHKKALWKKARYDKKNRDDLHNMVLKYQAENLEDNLNFAHYDEKKQHDEIVKFVNFLGEQLVHDFYLKKHGQDSESAKKSVEELKSKYPEQFEKFLNSMFERVSDQYGKNGREALISILKNRFTDPDSDITDVFNERDPNSAWNLFYRDIVDTMDPVQMKGQKILYELKEDHRRSDIHAYAKEMSGLEYKEHIAGPQVMFDMLHLKNEGEIPHKKLYKDRFKFKNLDEKYQKTPVVQSADNYSYGKSA